MINELLRILKAKFPDLCGIYLFGSRARGNYQNTSDFDILIVFKRNIDWRFTSEVRGAVFEFMVKNDILIDSIICSHNEMNNPSTPLELNAKKEGIYYGI